MNFGSYKTCKGSGMEFIRIVNQLHQVKDLERTKALSLDWQSHFEKLWHANGFFIFRKQQIDTLLFVDENTWFLKKGVFSN